MWLMENEKSTLGDTSDSVSLQELAYDKARKEFYQLRLDQDIERQVAKEEALHYDAYFDVGEIDRSVIKESAAFEDWKVWAKTEVEKDRQLQSGAAAGEATEPEEEEEEEEDQDLAQPLSADEEAQVEAVTPVEPDTPVGRNPRSTS
jgi:small subunit ribosomal protein S23